MGKAVISRESLLALAAAISVFMGYSFAHIQNIGLSFDEGIFINAALGGVTPDFIYKKIFGIPLMTFPYEGAVKAWLYYPVFKWFGVTIYSIRVPVILISFLTILVWFVNSKFLFQDRLYSILFLFLMSTDPSYIYHTRMDYNTLVLQGLFISLSFYLYWKCVALKKPAVLALLYLVMLTGVYNRLNFLWVVAAFFGAALLFHRRDAIRLYQRRSALTASLTLAFVVTLAVMFALLVVPLRDFPMGHIMNMSLGQKIIYTFHLYLNTMNGSFPYIKMFHRDTGAVSLVNGIEVGITLAALLWVSVSRLLCINSPAATDHDVKMGFCFTVCFMLLLMVALTPQARNSYHVMVLWPLPHLLFLLSMAVFSRHVSIKCARICLFVLVSCVISSQLVVNNRYLSALSQPGGYIDVSWSPAIYRLADYVNRHSGKYDEIVSVEAFNTQLLSFAADDGVRMKLHQEAWAILTNDESLKKMRDYILPGFKRGEKANLHWLYNAYFRNKKVLVITLAGGVYPAEVNFFRFARDYRLNLDQVAAINDAGGRTIYRLYAASTQREESLPQL